MSHGLASHFIVDLPVKWAETYETGLTQPTEESLSAQQPKGVLPSKTSPAYVCSTQRCLFLLCTFGLMIGLALGVWFLAKQLQKPSFTSEPLQDPGLVLTRCSDITEKEYQGSPLDGQGTGKKASFRIDNENFLLEVQAEEMDSWLLVCHENWEISLGTLICRQLGHVRVAHHKGVNLTDVKVNSAQRFAQVFPTWKGNLKPTWQIRSQCRTGRIVALKCSECGIHSKAPRIAEGMDSPQGLWPWQVSLYLNAKPLCLGSVVSREWIVSAAHCVNNKADASGLVVHAGAKEQTEATVEMVFPHPSYESISHDYDIALLKLKEPLNFSDTTQALCLPQYHQDPPDNTTCWISDWDSKRPENAQIHVARIVKEAPVTLLNTKKCNNSCAYAGKLTPRMLCASYSSSSIDTCQGNKGGPLTCQQDQTWHLAGIVSKVAGCAEPSLPGIYTKVVEFLGWIYHIMETY